LKKKLAQKLKAKIVEKTPDFGGGAFGASRSAKYAGTKSKKHRNKK
jgi:hypothetical protein